MMATTLAGTTVTAVTSDAMTIAMDAEMTVRSSKTEAVAAGLLVVAVAVDVDVVAPLLGSMPHAKSAIRRGTTPRTAGLATPLMMIMVTRRFMPHTASTQIGTKTRVLRTISQVNSTIWPSGTPTKDMTGSTPPMGKV
jgi:hypothetical protein